MAHYLKNHPLHRRIVEGGQLPFCPELLRRRLSVDPWLRRQARRVVKSIVRGLPGAWLKEVFALGARLGLGGEHSVLGRGRRPHDRRRGLVHAQGD